MNTILDIIAGLSATLAICGYIHFLRRRNRQLEASLDKLMDEAKSSVVDKAFDNLIESAKERTSVSEGD